MTDKPPIGGADLIERLLRQMTGAGASDLFVAVGRPPAVRVHGQMMASSVDATSAQQFVEFLDEVLPPMAREKLEETGDLDMGFSLPETEQRFRFNISRQRGGYQLVARALPTGELDTNQLGLPAAIRDLASRARGLVLVTGATGSGKSTTLAAIVHHINSTRATHIVTIEDPIEFVHRDIHSRITQREVGIDTASFHSGLRHALRQSPDVIIIGELRDAETMQVALSASLTGHLVFATLHTVDATQTLQRMLSYFPEHQRDQVAVDLSMSLQGIISQRLLPTADGQGRALAVELLTMTPTAARLIREQRVEELYDLMRAADTPDIVTFNESLLQLYSRGTIDLATGHAHATNPDEFALAAKGMKSGVAAFRQRGDDIGSALDMKSLLQVAVHRGASDLHLAVGRPPMLRVQGNLRPMEMPPLTSADMRVLLFSILSVRQRTAYELERELDFALQLENGDRFRVNAYYQRGTMAASLRAIPTRIPSAQWLQLPTTLLEMAKKPHGLLLVTGPTGSGKTTTLACLLDTINHTRSCRIITIEDPIEYSHVGDKATIDQRELHDDTHTFAQALKYVLRQDPDVILVGEMRDYETIGSALTAAETGHLVLATLHTNDASQAIDRIIDSFPAHQQGQARSQLAMALVGVVSQRLLPHASGDGRVPAFEILVATPAVRTLVREDKMHQALGVMETSRQDGMVTMDRTLRDLWQAGHITKEDALRFARHPKQITGESESGTFRATGHPGPPR